MTESSTPRTAPDADATTAAAALADELLDALFEADPLTASLYGFRERDERLPDNGVEAENALRGRVADIATRASALDPAELSTEDRLTREMMLEQARSMIDHIDSRAVEYTISGNFLAPAAGLLFTLPQIPVFGEEQARAYLVRLAAIPQFLDAVAERHRQGVAAGLLPVRHLVDAAVEHLDRHLADPDNDPLLTAEMPSGELDGERSRLLSEVVRPALRRYRDALEGEIAPHARSASHPGLCWLPGGEDTYLRFARAHTTTDRNPRELHETGLRLLEELRAEYSEIGSRALGVSEPAEVLERLRSDPALRWNDEEELLTAARSAVERAESAAPQWFGHTPSRRCAVDAVPVEQAPASPMAFYMPPALDGSRPGTFFANTHQPRERARYLSEATAFHEAVPGHHFQLSIAQELERLPKLRRLVPVTAYAEGWGLYCERLADEMGLYSDDVARMGMLVLDSTRACRLVVDTGIHALGWSRQHAIDFMAEHTAMPRNDIESEVDRYIVYPGQALAYMVGKLELRRIRTAAQRALGERFDIRAFHDVVLGHGSLPLSALDQLVTEWAGAEPA